MSQSYLRATTQRAADVAAASVAFAPGDEVIIHGLRSSPQLNNQQGVVQPRDKWADNGRVAVLLHTTPRRSVSVRPANLREWTKTCFICLESASESPLIPTGCGCRGFAGWVHKHCAIRAAVAATERAGSWKTPGRSPWQVCDTCRTLPGLEP